MNYSADLILANISIFLYTLGTLINRAAKKNYPMPNGQLVRAKITVAILYWTATILILIAIGILMFQLAQ